MMSRICWTRALSKRRQAGESGTAGTVDESAPEANAWSPSPAQPDPNIT